MEESRLKSRVAIQDPTYDHIQERRHNKHLQSIAKLRSFDKKSNSHYLVAPSRTGSLDKAKRVREQTHKKIFPSDSQYLNCMKKVKQIQQSNFRLPKLSNLRLSENRQFRNEEEQSRLDRENKLFKNKISGIEKQKKHQRADLNKFKQNYELYKKISRRNREISCKLQITRA